MGNIKKKIKYIYCKIQDLELYTKTKKINFNLTKKKLENAFDLKLLSKT